MKFQCEACERLIPLESYRLESGGLVVSCQRCGAESRARAAQPLAVTPSVGGEPLASARPVEEPVLETAARASAPALRVVRGAVAAAPPLDDDALFVPPPGHCPKCVSTRREVDTSCSQCGLVYANFVESEHQPSEALREEWRRLAGEWGQWEAHDRLLTLAMGRGELATAGRLYRVRLARAPDDAVAQRAREEIVRRATVVVPTEVEGAGASLLSRRMRGVAIAVLFLVVLLMSAFIIQRVGVLLSGDVP
ncbi:hypothetical protein SAMN05443572_104488 [Myxococcus fulvus]|uniref:Uncharacterized protein n=1 Tax=Myxococcus fulvus TaxID=33 RepID=A0A511SZ65_MYXFU|nr:hypothetical protein [Myxococcus fulvus]GEN06887.1 hypothetical protein MFU01_19240 [Myxococcus fulvus]SEU03534.1 hypothetical protein SAMN05443572_104488 [Myxococcus fulvus]